MRANHEIALDLEFDNNRYTYGLNLCLVQVCDRADCFLIDPFAVSNLRPLWDLLEDAAITKIFHCANSDILLLKTLGCAPRNILDTEVAVKILNYQKTSLAHSITVNLGVELDKSLQVSNWNTRPLTPQQLEYAAADVTYLHELKDTLLEELRRLNREHWLEEEGRQLELIEYRENTESHLKLKEANRLTSYHQFILKELFHFRDQLGRRFNKPPAFIIPNDVLVSIALKPVVSPEEWCSLRGLHRQIKDVKHFKLFKETLENAQRLAEEQQIPHRYPTPYRRPPLSIPDAEVERRKRIADNLRQTLIQRYGENTAPLLLGQNAVSEFCQGNNLIIRKQYALEIILELAAELHIDPALLHLESAIPA